MNDNTRTPLSNSSNTIFLWPTPLLHTPSKDNSTSAVVMIKKRHQDVQFDNPRHSFAPLPTQSRQSYDDDSPRNDSRHHHHQADVHSSTTTTVAASIVDENEALGADADAEDFILTVPGSAMDNNIEYYDFTSKPFLLPRFSRHRNHFDLTL